MVYKPRNSANNNNNNKNNEIVKKTSDKKVKFALANTIIQDEKDYQETLKTNPDIPFNSEKQPEHSIFKNKGMRSPINRYYKFTDYWDRL